MESPLPFYKKKPVLVVHDGFELPQEHRLGRRAWRLGRRDWRLGRRAWRLGRRAWRLGRRAWRRHGGPAAAAVLEGVAGPARTL